MKEWNDVKVNDDQYNELSKLNEVFEEPQQFGFRSIRENFNYADILDDVEAEIMLFEENEPSLVNKTNHKKAVLWLKSAQNYTEVTV